MNLYIRGDYMSCPNPLSLDPYNMCPYNCKYCFIKQMEETILKNKVKYGLKPYKLKSLSTAIKKRSMESSNPAYRALAFNLPVIIGRKCEPLCKQEEDYEVTFFSAKMLHDNGIKCAIETKTGFNIEKYLPYVNQISLSIMPGKIHNAVEPGLPSYEKRLETAKKVKDAGVRLGVVGEPIMPGYNTSKDDLTQWLEDLAELKPDHINFGELRFHAPKIAHEMLSEANVDLLNVVRGMKNWKNIGNFIFDYAKDIGLKVSTPDWVNFADRNACLGCCGLDSLGTSGFNWQTAYQNIKEYGSINWNDMLKYNVFGKGFEEKFSVAFNKKNDKFYSLDMCENVKAVRQHDGTINYKIGKRKSISEVFKCKIQK